MRPEAPSRKPELSPLRKLAVAGTREHGLASEVALDILQKSVRSRVPFRRVLAQRFENDGVEIPAQRAGKPFCSRRARGSRHVAVDGLAGPRNIDVQYRLLELCTRARLEPIGTCSREQLEQEHAERIDIRSGRHALSAQVLR